MSSEILNKKSIFEPHRASQVKRAAAYLIDLILFLVVFTGVLYLVSIIIGFQDSLDKLNKVEKITKVGNGIAEKLAQDFTVLSRQIKNHAGLLRGPLIFHQKIVYNAVVLRQDAGSDCGMYQESLHLLRGEMPHPIDSLSR